MIKNVAKLSIILIIVLVLLSSCSRNDISDIENHIINAGNRVVGENDENSAIVVEYAIPDETNTHLLNERIVLNDCGNDIAYAVKSIDFYDSLNSANVNASEFTSVSKTLNITTKNEIVDGCELILISIDITALELLNEENISVSDMQLFVADFDENKYIENYSDEKKDDRFISGLPSNSNNGPDYFFLKNSETATRSSNQSKYFHYSLGSNETVEVDIGFIVRADIIQNYDIYMRIGADPENVQYIKLFDLKD